MSNNQEELKLQLRPRATEVVSLNIPKDTLVSIEEVAVSKDTAVSAFMRYKVE